MSRDPDASRPPAPDGPGTAPAMGAGECPVCLRPFPAGGRERDCPGCGWTLFGDLVLGPVTAEDERVFTERLRGWRRRYDLVAAARAAAAGAAPMAALAALARPGPEEPGEWERAAREAAAREAAGAAHDPVGDDALSVARALLAEVVVEIGAEHVVVTRFRIMPSGDVCELADLDVRDWAAVLPMLAADPVERRFQLAGGVGARPIADAAAEEALERGLPALPAAGGDRTVIVDRVPGWPLPARAAALLASRRPGARLRAGRPVSGVRAAPLALRCRGPITAFAATPGGDVLAFGGADGSARTWSVAADAAGPARTRHADRVSAVALSADGELLVSGAGDGTVMLCPRSPVGPARLLTVHAGRVTGVWASPGMVISLGEDGTLHRIPLDGGTGGIIEAGPSASAALAVPADGGRAATGGTDALVRLWTGGGPAGPVETVPGGGQITALAFDPAGRRLAIGRADGAVARWAGGRAETLPGPAPVGARTGPVRGVAMTADGGVAAVSEDGGVRWWPPGGPPRCVVLGAHDGAVRGVAAVHGRVLSTGADGLIRAWAMPGDLGTD